MHTSRPLRTLPRLACLSLALCALSAQADTLSEAPVETTSCTPAPITREIVWEAGSSREISGTYRVPAGTRLTIQAGATVRFRDGSLSVKGALVIAGKDEAPVLLTTAYPTRGMADADIVRWEGISIFDEATVQIDHANILYAGTPDPYTPFSSAISVYSDCGFVMNNTALKYSQRGGVLFSSSHGGQSPAHRIANSTISHNTLRGLSIFGDYVHVEDSEIADNGTHAVWINLLNTYHGRRSKFNGNDIVGNRGGGIYLQLNAGIPLTQQPSGHRNNLVDNGDDGSAQIDMYLQYGSVFHPWGVVSDIDGDNDLVDWSDNYFGGPFYPQQCPLAYSVPPLLGPGGRMPPLVHLSPDSIPNPCEKPEQGPAAQKTYDQAVPVSVCEDRAIYCAVNRIKVTPHAETPFLR